MSTESSTPAPLPTSTAAAAIKRPLDVMPFERTDLARFTPEQRCAIYLNSIRKMMIFFVVLATVGIVAGVIIGIIDINAVHSAQQSGGTLGY
jgi:hypothetical protein